jgi:hypothetical protein
MPGQEDVKEDFKPFQKVKHDTKAPAEASFHVLEAGDRKNVTIF